MKLIKIIFLMLLISNNSFANINYFDEGVALYNENKLVKAKFKFEQDILFNPKSEMSYLYLSKIFKKKKKKNLEEQNLNTVILLNPKNEEAIYSFYPCYVQGMSISLQRLCYSCYAPFSR